jgi:hypothetical protein
VAITAPAPVLSPIGGLVALIALLVAGGLAVHRRLQQH